MKRLSLSLLGLFIILMISYSFRFSFDGYIKGKVVPAGGAAKARFSNQKDSAAVDIYNGIFTAPVKEGTYKVEIEALPPYKNAVIEVVNVSEGATTDIGEIKLQQ